MGPAGLRLKTGHGETQGAKDSAKTFKKAQHEGLFFPGKKKVNADEAKCTELNQTSFEKAFDVELEFIREVYFWTET